MITAPRRLAGVAIGFAFLVLAARPALAQYTVEPTAPGFVDISGTGTSIPSAVGDDVLSTAVNFPAEFTFSFYGAAKTAFKVASNGVLTFNTALTSITATNATTVPSTAAPNDIIAPFWDDLDNDDIAFTPGAQVHFFHDVPNSRLIVQWTNWRRWQSTGSVGSLTFQIHLYSTTGNIEVHYATMTNPGTSYTVAVENSTGTVGTPLFINPASGGVASNTSYLFALATTPILSVSPRSVNFPSAGPCVGIAFAANIVVNNVGIGSISLDGASLSGSGAFTLGTQPVYPAPLPPSRTIQVIFNPTPGMSGPQTAVLTLNYNDGTPQTTTVNVYGSADAEGAGIALRSTGAAAGCENGVPAPGTALVDISAHTRIVTWTTPGSTVGDDSVLRLDVTTIPNFSNGFRLFGVDRTSIAITPNGLVSFNLDLPTFYGGLGVIGDETIQVGAMDLNTNATTYAADNAGQFGLPGVFYGTSDVDADGDLEFVITWWHVHDFGSPSWPMATARFFTSQLIIYQADQPNADDLFEMRFPSGNDANGVPYRNSTTVGGSPTIEADVAIGIGEGVAGEAAIYRNGANFGGAMYPGGASNGIRFQPEAQEMATGAAGWRMLGAPVRNYDIGRLSRVNLVQGVANQYPTAADNVRTGYDGTDWILPASTSDVLMSGRGFLWYLYNLTFDPDDPDGTSNSYALPTRLEGTGAEPALTNGVLPVALHASGNGWNLLANPFREDLDISAIGSWAAGGTLASAVGQMWEPDGSTYVLTSTQGDDVSTWQGFMLQNSSATALNIPPIPRTTGVVLVGRELAPRHVAFELAGTRADNNAPTLDRSAVLYFGEDADASWDLRDAGKLVPLAERYATIAFLGDRDGNPVLKAQESRAQDITAFEVPLAVSAIGTTPTLTLTWPTFENVPDQWIFRLRDLLTGAEVDLRTQDRYEFEVAPAEPRATTGGMPVLGDAVASLADARFMLSVTSATTGTDGGVPTVYALHTPAPNPVTGPSAVVRFDLPEASEASIDVFDMLGRRVAILAEGAREAGRHAARLDARDLASGSYVIRMRAGDFVQAQRITILR